MKSLCVPSVKAAFEILFPAEACGKCQRRQDLIPVSNHGSAADLSCDHRWLIRPSLVLLTSPPVGLTR